MQKKFLIEQPPHSDKYRLLVDDINETETFAVTLDSDKVWYNRKILGDDLSINLETYTALSTQGLTSVLPIGRFVTIWQISKDEKIQRIWFFDCKSEVSFRDVNRKNMEGYFSDNVCDEFEKIQTLLRSSFTNELDIIELVLPI